MCHWSAVYWLKMENPAGRVKRMASVKHRKRYSNVVINTKPYMRPSCNANAFMWHPNVLCHNMFMWRNETYWNTVFSRHHHNLVQGECRLYFSFISIIDGATPLSTIVPGRHLLPLAQCVDGLRKCPEGKLIPSLSLGNAKSHMKGEWKRSVTDHTRAAESWGTEQQRNRSELGLVPLCPDSKCTAAGSSHSHFPSKGGPRETKKMKC